ncbi:COG1361 S-layer family protein [Candidatus Woesearchaeota archaeon]|nr:COG1361 S-layer family protein [Candidatus Woesearchaeota archaeon]
MKNENRTSVAYYAVFAMIFVTSASMILVSNASLASAELDNAVAVTASLVNQDPDPAVAGDVVEVRISLQNIGGQGASNLMVELEPSYPFSLVSGVNAVQEVGPIQGYQGYYDTATLKIVKYKVRVDKDASAGSYELKVSTYEKGSSSKKEKSLSVDVQSRESAEVIHIDKTILIPGKQTSLRFSINNVGNAPLRDLTFYWENEDQIILPVGSDNTRYVKYIDIGERAEIEYQVIADSSVTAGLYPLDLHLSYEDALNRTTKTISTVAGIYVGGGTDFDITFSESSSGQTSFTIANIGSNPASSVSVIVPQQSGWSVSGANSMIIGNLNTGDYTVASFNLQSSLMMGTMRDRNATRQDGLQSPQSQNSLKVQIAYTDTMGNREIVEKDVLMAQQSSMNLSASTMGSFAGQASFRGYQRQSFFVTYKNYIIIGLLLVLVVVGVIFYGKYKKEKMLDPNFQFKNLFQRDGQKFKKR